MCSLNLDMGNHSIKQGLSSPVWFVCWLRVLQLAEDHSYIIVRCKIQKRAYLRAVEAFFVNSC